MVRKLAQQLVNGELLLLLLLVPPLFLPTPARAAAALLIPLLWVGRRVATGALIPRTPLDGSLLLLLVMVLASLAISVEPLLSFPKALGVVLGVGFFYGLAGAARGRVPFWRAALFVALIAGALVGLAVVGSPWKSRLDSLDPFVSRIPRLIGGVQGAEGGFSPNSVAGMTLLLALPLLGLALGQRGRPLPFGPALLRPLVTALLWLAGLALCFLVLLTQSWSGYIGLAVGLLALLFLPRPRIAVALALAMLVFSAWALPTYAVALLERVPTGSKDGLETLAERVEVWQRAGAGVADFPVAGMGMSAFQPVVHRYYPFFDSDEAQLYHPHNLLLAAAVDLGLPGLVAYLALCGGALAMAWQSARRAVAPPERALGYGLAAGLLAHLAWGMTDASVLGARTNLLFWLALGTVAGLHRLVMGAQPQAADAVEVDNG